MSEGIMLVKKPSPDFRRSRGLAIQLWRRLIGFSYSRVLSLPDEPELEWPLGTVPPLGIEGGPWSLPTAASSRCSSKRLWPILPPLPATPALLRRRKEIEGSRTERELLFCLVRDLLDAMSGKQRGPGTVVELSQGKEAVSRPKDLWRAVALNKKRKSNLGEV